jgi:hypothetical protein
VPALVDERKASLPAQAIAVFAPGIPEATLMETWPTRIWRQERLGRRKLPVCLDAEGMGHYVGCNINYDNLAREDASMEWPAGWPWRMPAPNTERDQSLEARLRSFWRSSTGMARATT